MPAANPYERETTVTLGGHRHFVYAGGARDGPLLLLCHGGPGYSELPMIRSDTYARLLEDVLLVTWEQRGTARSYSDELNAETLTVARLLDDAVELVDWARHTFDRDTVHLLGHSWGGCLALLLAGRVTGALESVFALCPFVNLGRSCAIAYAEMLARGEERGDAIALAELGELGPPPYTDLHSAMSIHTTWVIDRGDDGMVRARRCAVKTAARIRALRAFPELLRA